METIVDRIRLLCKKSGTSITKIEAELGYANGTIGKWSKSKRPPPLEKIIAIANRLDCSIDYLRSGESGSFQQSNGIKIPVLGDVAAGIPIEAITDILDYEEIDEAMAKTGEFFGLRIKGDSMEPRMQEGDVVIVRKQDTAVNGDTVVVLVNGDSATVKKIKYGPDGITLISSNPSHDPIFYSAGEVESLPVRVIGRVVELRAKY